MRLILCDLHGTLADAWRREFAGWPEVEVRAGDLLEISADAYVSPANSYGWMDGGIDLALRDRFGHEIQDAVQERIEALGGRLPVGEAIVVETGDDEVPYLICAPTMVVPSWVAETNHAYLAMGALLRAAGDFNQGHPGAIETIGIPGLCTGTGGMPPQVAARQMRAAWEEFLGER
jgi:O-acetyl-ADP-ribose deacetylase (regulator of RNase III)